ncbi:MAG: NAD(P)/FAD-dependent oxidoreductase [Acidobacteria bacterium]|nr:NAD(P)/FAD-dependent oxidoreductase [Acidobacteriota bacterium]
MSRVLITGAGPAGLTAAYELSKLGLEPTVLEADNLVGGISRTVDYKGYRFDIGGHRFFSKVPLINELWDEILREDFLVRPRLSRIYYRQKFFDYPLKAANALAGLGPVEAFMIGLSYAKSQFFPQGDETNFEQWVINRFGERLYRIFFKTYTEKVWGIPCHEISADWAAQRIKNLSFREAIRSALLGATRTEDGQVITTLIDQFNYPRLGPGMMWEHCRDLLAARGHETISGVRVERLRHKHGRVESAYGRTSSGEVVEFGADHFISTMPLRELIHSLDPLPPDDVLAAANMLRYRDYLTVVLIAKREAVFPDNWIYIHEPDVKMGRIQNYKNWSPEMVPDASRSSLGLEYFLWEKDEEWDWSHERLIELGIKECAQIGLIEPDEIEDGTVVRMKKAYPVYDQGYQENLDTIQHYLETLSNLQTVGRNGLHRYNNQDHSMLTAVYAARNIVGENNDVWSVNTEMEYHEEAKTPAGTGDRMVPQKVTVPVSDADELIVETFARLDPLALGVSLGSVTGVLLFLATVILLLKGGPVIGPRLGLLGNFFFGYQVTWTGAFLVMVQGAIGGLILGYLIAVCRNWIIDSYGYIIRRTAEAKASRDMLDKV